MVGVSSLRVLLDYVMANIWFLAFPWNTLAHSQYLDKCLLQWAGVFGEYRIAFVVIAVNYVLFYYRDLSHTVLSRYLGVLVLIHLAGAGIYYLSVRRISHGSGRICVAEFFVGQNSGESKFGTASSSSNEVKRTSLRASG